MVGASRTQQDELELSEAVVRTASGGTSSSHDVVVGVVLVRKRVSRFGAVKAPRKVVYSTTAEERNHRVIVLPRRLVFFEARRRTIVG
jgi:phage FluMu protein gp41